VAPPRARTPGAIEDGLLSFMFTVGDKPGALTDILKLFENHGVNLTSIESRPSKGINYNYDMHVTFEGAVSDPHIAKCLDDVRKRCVGTKESPPVTVPWFPTRIGDIDTFSQKTLDAGAELDCDHPGFKDEEYRERRRMIVEISQKYKIGELIPRIKYTANEVATWGLVYSKLKEYTKKYAARQYNYIMPSMESNCGYSETNIPQLQDISDYLKSCTGFQLKPVGGLLSARDFLNGLAFRVFFSTQYIRHHSVPLYTPEPDICHELIGHAPLFADPVFAEFSQDIGLASLGASDEDVKKLATCYWFTVEFGLVKEGGLNKAYGAGLLSSFGEIEYACSPSRPAGGMDNFPKYLDWDPEVASATTYPITTYQPSYFVAESMGDMKQKMRAYCDSRHKPFHVKYDTFSQTVSVDRAVTRGPYRVTLQG